MNQKGGWARDEVFATEDLFAPKIIGADAAGGDPNYIYRLDSTPKNAYLHDLFKL